MTLRLAYFAWVRERIGLDGETVAPPVEVTTVAALVAWLATRSPAHRAALTDQDRLRAAIDERFVAMDSAIAGAREVAIFPPVTGG